MALIVVMEDDAGTRTLIASVLRKEGHEVVSAEDGAKGLALVEAHPPDLIISDVQMPGLNGFEMLAAVRREPRLTGIPVILLTSLQERVHMRIGMTTGADDYITKPFSVSELMARVEALARRVRRSATADDEQAGSEPDQLVSGPFVLDEKSRVLYKSGKPIDLTQVEFQIMELFFRNPGTALVREKILEGVWGKGYFGDVKIVDVNIRRLRMKVEDEPSSPQHILTVWGYGYRWNA